MPCECRHSSANGSPGRSFGRSDAPPLTGAVPLLLQAEAACDCVGLVLYELELVARAYEVEHVDRAAVGLQVVDAPGHRLAAARVLVCRDDAGEATRKAILLAADEAGQERELR